MGAPYHPSLASQCTSVSVCGTGLVLGCDILPAAPAQRWEEAAGGGSPAGCETGGVLCLLCALQGPANSKLYGEAGLGSKKQIN